MRITSNILLSFTLVLIAFTICQAGKTPYIPEQLRPWVDWVLHDKEEQQACVSQHNDGTTYQCYWPTELKIVLNDRGGTFEQSWLVLKEGWISLIGNNRHWPQNIQVDGEDVVVLEKNEVPTIRLTAGTYKVTGNFTWTELPEHLAVPVQSGLIDLEINRKKIQFPDFDNSGRLWLKREKSAEIIEDRLKIESFRLIDDLIPPRIIIHVTMEVAGSAREITLGPLYDARHSTPVSLESTLPARLEQDGKITLQVRPGRYNLTVTVRHDGPLHQLRAKATVDSFWPEQEIWSFRSHPDLRLVEIDGGIAIDPVQTSVPKHWHKYPAYRMSLDDTLIFKEIKRGDPHPAPDQLSLDRKIWLRFDGSGYTIQDKIRGKKNTNWRLEMDPAIRLGRVEVDGAERYITRQQGSEQAGVELRNGLVNLSGDSLLEGALSPLPATGWDHDFQEVKGVLFLPPGWKLLHSSGVDNISRTWLKRWTLLDIFIVLIFTIAVARLFSIPLAIISLFTMVCIYHEPGAPRYVWLALLLAITLLKYLPTGKFKNFIKVYYGLTILCLIIITIPYTVESLRIGIFPQLARPWVSMSEHVARQQVTRGPAPDTIMTEQSQEEVSLGSADIAKTKFRRKTESLAAPMLRKSTSPYYTKQVMQFDPKTITQTGPGLPKWYAFETVHFNWSGPVTRDQTINLTLIGPKTNLALAFIRLTLIIFLGLGMLGIGYSRKGGFSFGCKQFFAILPLTLLLYSPHPAQCDEIPSPQLLEQLQQRLLEQDKCFPNCAAIHDISLNIDRDKLILKGHIDAQIDTAVPLPSHVKHWMPRRVLIDGETSEALLRRDDNLWIMVPKGKHLVQLSGPIRNQNTLQLPFPLKPYKLSAEAEGWVVEGIHPDGSFDSQLQFKRLIAEENKQNEILETGILPPFIKIERTLFLGLEWQIQTKIERLSPPGSAVVLDIPLIQGESVTTPGIRVKDGKAKINLRSDQSQLLWESFLDPVDTLTLEHSASNLWTEIWRVDVSPIFHMDYQGIPVILHKTGNHWYPTWHPWPGEKVVLNFSRPQGIEGQTLTIEDSHLLLQPGRRSTGATLRLSVKSSQGGQHIILLPQGAKLQEVKVNNKVQPIRQEGRELALPITPGQQRFELQWLEPRGITMHYQSSGVDLTVPSVNTGVDVRLPKNRWPLLVGGEQLVGPAVLFWSVVIIIFLVAFGLSKTGLTPLRFHHWFLLGIGMSMSNLAASLVIVGWLIALDLRKKVDPQKVQHFNLIQTGIGILTFGAAVSLIFAISQGLLGHPDMNIVGNGSSSSMLRWYHDVSDRTLPQAWVFSIPMLAYRFAMLAWALWISFWLIGILKWGWQQFTTPTIWHNVQSEGKTIGRWKKKQPKETKQDE